MIFYNSVKKHGWNKFKFGILEYVDINNNNNKTVLLEREQYYLDIINPSLNICKIAGSPLGIKHDISFSINLSKARRGKKHNVNKIKTISSKPITSETRLKLSCRSKGISVKIFDQKNNLIDQFSSMLSAANYLGVSDRTIRRVLNTGISYDNFIYKFEIEKENPIVVINKEINTIKEYHSIRAMAKDMGISRSTIMEYINTNKLLDNIYLITK